MKKDIFKMERKIKVLRRRRQRLLDEWFHDRSTFKTPETCRRMIIKIEDEIMELRLLIIENF
jgi:hypothetical protein